MNEILDIVECPDTLRNEFRFKSYTARHRIESLLLLTPSIELKECTSLNRNCQTNSVKSTSSLTLPCLIVGWVELYEGLSSNF